MLPKLLQPIILYKYLYKFTIMYNNLNYSSRWFKKFSMLPHCSWKLQKVLEKPLCLGEKHVWQYACSDALVVSSLWNLRTIFKLPQFLRRFPTRLELRLSLSFHQVLMTRSIAFSSKNPIGYNVFRLLVVRCCEPHWRSASLAS